MREVGIGAENGYLGPDGVVRKNMFGYLLLVLGDEAVGSGDNRLGGAIVLFELEDSEIGVLLLQIENVADVGSAKRVDALRIVTHDTEVVMTLHQLVDNKVLGKVGVLVLVDQDISELVLIKFQHVGIVAEKDIGVEQQVVKVHSAGPGTTGPVGLVDIANERAFRPHVGLIQGGVGGISRGGHQRILGIGDNGLHGRGPVYFIIEHHLLDDGLDEAAGVGLVIYREIAIEADALGMGAQNAGKYRVESAHPQPGGGSSAYDGGNALLHLTSRLVGKREGQYLIRAVIARSQQIGYFVGQHTGLARPCTGNDQRGAFVVKDRFALLVVEFLQKIFFHASVFRLFPDKGKENGRKKLFRPRTFFFSESFIY